MSLNEGLEYIIIYLVVWIKNIDMFCNKLKLVINKLYKNFILLLITNNQIQLREKEINT